MAPTSQRSFSVSQLVQSSVITSPPAGPGPKAVSGPHIDVPGAGDVPLRVHPHIPEVREDPGPNGRVQLHEAVAGPVIAYGVRSKSALTSGDPEGGIAVPRV